MASTPDQQYLTDTKTLNSPEQCCLTLGGSIASDSEGNEICILNEGWSMLDPSATGEYEAIPLTLACSEIDDVVEDEPSSGWTWNQGLFDDLISSAGNIWDIFKPTPDVPPPATGNGNGQPPPPPAPPNDTAKYIMIGGGVLLLIVAVYLIAKKK